MTMFQNINSIALIVLLVCSVIYVLLWMGITIWTSRDIRRRTKKTWLQLVAVVFVLIFSLPGLLLYLIFRPLQTKDQMEAQQIEERIIRSIDDITSCYNCDMDVHKSFVYCPYCRTKLRSICPKCQGLLEDDWSVCAYCGTPAPKHSHKKNKK